MNSLDIIPVDEQQRIHSKYCEEKKYASNVAELITKVVEETIVLVPRCEFKKLHDAFDQTRMELDNTREELETSKQEAAKLRAELDQLKTNSNLIPSLAQLTGQLGPVPVVVSAQAWSPPTVSLVQAAVLASQATDSGGECTGDMGSDINNLNKAKRAQCAIACVNCRQQHVVCEQRRPCSRCIKRGMEGSCIDIPRKKRCKKSKGDCSEPATPTPTTPPQIKELTQEQPPPS